MLAIRAWLGAVVAGLAFAACSSGDVVSNVDETDLAVTGSSCVTTQSSDGRLCFEYRSGEVFVVASGLRADSTMTVTGANGDTASFGVDGGALIEAQIGDRLVLAPFTASGTWANGEAAELTVDVAG